MSSKTAIQLQKKSLEEMEKRAVYKKRLAGFEYEVFPRVYKGSTDTEIMCKVLENKVKNRRVWEIGTGTGLIALSAKMSGAQYVLATDLNPDAVLNAKRNSKLLNLDIDVLLQDLFGTINKKFDILIFNPPYTNHRINKDRKFEISFWDPEHKTIENFIKNVSKYKTSSGRVFIGWSSFAKVSNLKKIVKKYNFKLVELGRKTGKRKFVYYVFELISI